MTSDKKTENSHPIDRGWAWVIMFGVSLQLFLNVGVMKSFGIFFIEFLVVYDTNASLMSGVIAIQTAVFTLSSLFILNLGSKKIGPRRLVIIGSILIPSGYLLNAFAPNVAFLILSQSVLFGAGCAFAMGPGLVILSSYFDKKRGFANSISNVGGSIGSFVFPKIIQILIDEYGLQGSLIFVAGILFNNLIAAALLRPLLNNTKRATRQKEEEIPLATADVDIVSPEKEEAISVPRTIITENPKNIHNNESNNINILLNYELTNKNEVNADYNSKSEDPFKQVRDKYDYFLNEKKLMNELSRSTIDLSTSISNIACSLQSLQKMNTTDASEGSDKPKCSLKSFCGHFIDFKLLKNHHLQLVLFVAFFCVFGCGLTITYIPPFASDHGISNENVAVIVMIVGGCDIVGRFSVAWVADSKKIRRTLILATTLLITGTTILFNSLFTDFVSFIILAVVYGLFGAVYFSFCPLLLIDSAGAENLAPALSLLILVHGISISIMAPLLGYMRDSTGSYHVTFYVIGSGMIVAAIALLCEPWFKRWEENRIKSKSISSTLG